MDITTDFDYVGRLCKTETANPGSGDCFIWLAISAELFPRVFSPTWQQVASAL
jgi:hypothetical protein